MPEAKRRGQPYGEGWLWGQECNAGDGTKIEQNCNVR
jgi:hypothetical protein